ncbi:MAG: hypothetical protein ABFD64_05085 [Armatimonadota bacterium]
MKQGWLRRYWEHVVFVPASMGLFIWLGSIAMSNGTNKATWLLLPITGIYAVISAYIAVAGFRSASSSSKSTEIMAKTLEEMMFSRLLQYAPEIRFRGGYEYISETSDNAIGIQLRNMSPGVPVLGLRAFLWELETTDKGKNLKYSSMCETSIHDYEENNIDLRLMPSNISEEYKYKLGMDAFEKYMQEHNETPPSQDALCILYYTVRGFQQQIRLTFDLKLHEHQAKTSAPKAE